jgi:hypothetical protein
MKRALLLLSGLLVAPAVFAQTNLFPFVLPWDDATPSVADVSAWLDKPAGARGFVTPSDGHFYVGTQRIRFFGVNFVGPGAFPRHEDADKIAGRLAKFGINVVRFHHMDSGWSPLIAYAQGTSRQLNPGTLDRLDYLIAQLKQHGTYANLNLLVGRQFKAADGLPSEIEQLDSKEQHVVGFFYAPVLELQKEYARQLLTHRNAYTGNTYIEDPAVAFVEINNENGLIHSWLGGGVDKLPAVFLRDLQRQWNDWLRARYGSTARLRQAWNIKAEPLGDELLAAGTHRWVLEQHEGAEANLADGCITVTKTGRAGWHVQFNQPGIKLTGNRAYTVRFLAKADRPVTVTVNVGEAHAEWQGLGLSAPVALTTEWREFRFTFNAERTEDNARVCFSDLAKQTGNYWFADVSLRPGGVMGLEDHERFEDASLSVFQHGNIGARTAEAQRDWIRFLWETEDHYWQTMYRYVKDELKFRGVVMGTIVGCSTPNLMAKFDAVDTHAYWQHPQFPGRPWDAGNWFVPNKTMVNERGGTLPALALRRVLGKPHCVTEYNHPAPNTYSSEGFLLLAAFAAMQDWDAVYAYDYCSRKDEWDARRIPNFFDIDQHPTKMATLPAAVAMFVRGDVQPARGQVVAPLDKEREIELLPRSHAWGLVAADVPPEFTLHDRVAISTNSSSLSRNQSASPAEFVWNTGLATVNTPRSKAVIGFTGRERIELGGVIIEPGQTMQNGWCMITATEMQSGHWLITATGYAGNTDMGWKNAEKSTVGRDWGRAPSLAEGIPAKIALPRAAQAWALDERGQRALELPLRNGLLEIGPQCRTLWYEVGTR